MLSNSVYLASLGDDESNNIKYGYLYPFFVIGEGIANTTDGWHVPSDAEWTQLTDYLVADVGAKLAGGFDLWDDGALRNNTDFGLTGFDALPGGLRSYFNGSFNSVGSYGNWWSSTESSALNAWSRSLFYDNSGVSRGGSRKLYGYSVRTVRATEPTESSLANFAIIPNAYTGNDGKKYDGVKIGSQVWITTNLAETKLNTGADIPEVTNDTDWSNLTTGARCSYNNDESNAFF